MAGTEEKVEGGWGGGSSAGETLGDALSSWKESSRLTARGTVGWVPTYEHTRRHKDCWKVTGGGQGEGCGGRGTE
ncbi:hypothetical protein TSUD_32960 [Trifolium subterraneum]|uniref:Uncharacterized protein n=1 Tax=Trifolium subterraneum TaxID=3900 RepID=A0A2Z6LPL4_TRISU|nr:hypothetical protein TSUD_32960 [Trifolium subterraneum]